MASTDLLYRFLGIDAGAGAQFDRMAGKTAMLGDTSKTTSAKVAALAKGAALAGAVIGVASIKMAADYQRAMTLIQTQAGASKAEVASFSKSLLAMAGKVGKSPDDLATSLYHVYSTGLRGAEALKAVKIAAEGAQVGNADLEETTNALTSTIASNIKGAGQYGVAMGNLIAIVGAGDMKLSDLNDALGTGVLSAARVFNVSLREAGAVLATFGDNNIRGADAATKLRMVMQDIAKPAANADEVLAQIGLTSDELRSKLQNHGLTAALVDLKDHMTNAGITAGKVGPYIEQAFTKKAGVGLGILIDQMGRYKQKLEEVGAGGKRFGSDWAATTKTFSFAFAQMRARVDSLLISLGQKLIPAATSAVQWLGTGLPHAAATLASILSPLVHLVGDGLAVAWHTVGGALRVAAGVLSSVGHFLEQNKAAVTAVVVALGAMWAAVKLIALAKAIFTGISAAITTMRLQASLAGMQMSTMSAGALAAKVGLVALGAGIAAVTYLWQKQKQEAAVTAEVVQGYTQAILADNDALGKHTRAQAISNLSQTSAYQLALKMGVSQSTLTSASLGNKAAIDSVTAAMHAYNDGSDSHIQAVQGLQIILGYITKDYKAGADAAHTFAAAQRDDAQAAAAHKAAVDASRAAAQRGADAVSRLAVSTRNETVATHAATMGMDGQSVSASRLAGYIQKLTTNFQKLFNAELSQKQAMLAFKSGLLQLTQQVKDNGTALGLNTSKGVANRQNLISLLQASEQAAEGSKNYGKALLGNVQSFIAFAMKAGYSKQQVDNLLHSLHLMPSQIRTKLHVETADAFRNIENFVHTPWTTYVQVVTTGNHAPSGGHTLSDPPVTGPGHGGSFGLNARFSGGLPNIDHRYGLDEIVTIIKKVKSYTVTAQNVAKELAIGFLTGWKDGSGSLKSALSSPVQRALEHMTAVAQNAIAHQAAILKKAQDNLKSDLKSRASDIRSLAGNLSGDLSGVFTTGTDLTGNTIPVTLNVNTFLGGQAKQLKNFAKDLKWFSKHGGSPALLSEIAGLGAVQGDEVLKQFMSGDASIAAANRAEAAINRYSKQAATTVEDKMYARRLAKDAKEVKEQTHELKRIRHLMEKEERHLARQISTHLTIDAKTGKPQVDKHFIDEIVKGIKKAERLAGKKLI